MGYWIKTFSAVVLVVIMAGCDVMNTRKGDVKVIEQEIMELMRRLDTLDERSRMMLLSQADEQRDELLGILLKHIGTSESKNVQAAAIYLIGRHHLSGGVHELVQRIDFSPGGQPMRGPEPLWEQYPAMEALINIGLPSIPATLELLATETINLRRYLAVKVIRYATDAEIAKFILERAWKNESEPARKANLQDALVSLNKLPR
ncbi:MAG: hypothetical protein H8D56_19350 [Planctomycetes bacterium]|nr:hypothetical protein [Planctomycetota bacterium]MBL7142758.1 hypothetical protein [Phycisphaerae bacterium]